MAISLSGSASGSNAFGNTFTFSLTVASGDDYIVAMVGITDGVVDSVKIDSGGADEASFTMADNHVNTGATNNPEAQIWYLLGTDIPSAGDYDIEVATSSDPVTAGAGAQAMSGTAQQAPEGTNGADGGGTSWSVDVTSTTVDAVVFDCGSANSPETETDDETQKIFGVEPGSAADVFGSHETSAGGTVTASWSFSNTAPGALVAASVAPAATGTTENMTATLAGTSTDSVGSIVLNLTGTTTLAGTSTTGGAITATELIALTATLAGTSSDTAAVSLKQAITATLAGVSADGGPVTVKNVVALAATLAGTSEDSGTIDLGPLVPGTYTTYDAVGIREDLQGKARGRSMSKRALERAEQQLNDLLNSR